jgi:hypothetical protein
VAAVRFPRLSPRMLVAGLAAVAAIGAVGAGVVALGDSGEAAPLRPEPVAAFRAEERLLRELSAGGLGDAVSVDCAGPVRAGRATRCQVGYSDGDTQLILVGLDADRTIDVDIPYPAQRRPG